MIRLLMAALLAAGIAAAAPAVADPEILLPTCSSGQVPQSGECVVNPLEGLFGDAAGANPNVPLGLTPLQQPIVTPLGLLPANLPGNLPLGPTPPNVSGR